MHVLAADVDLVSIVRRNRQRHRPVESIFEVGGNTVRLIGPHLDVPRLAPAFVVAHGATTPRARAGGAGRDDVRVDGIGRGPSALAAANCMPHAARDRRTRTAVARTAVRWIVLLVAVDVV